MSLWKPKFVPGDSNFYYTGVSAYINNLYGCFVCEASYCGCISYRYLIVSVNQGGRKPWNSINFICAHDGFTLADLVTYNNKNNLANGEENNDGENHNYSWNCGEVRYLFCASV